MTEIPITCEKGLRVSRSSLEGIINGSIGLGRGCRKKRAHFSGVASRSIAKKGNPDRTTLREKASLKILISNQRHAPLLSQDCGGS
jgi:hypothetical protein